MKGYKKINEKDMAHGFRYINKIESYILTKSNNHMLMDKFTTGFGWYSNLAVLYINQLIDSALVNKIKISHEFFNNLHIEKIVSTAIWNEYVKEQNEIIDALTF
ncbi:hypothetical protein [Oceanobacillus sp. FSL K6-0127]|uniref:hypothetical protein n=1 Tax=Oceanobacillus sp. FSL K6-0127 TaxID=2921420 RepID=UPI0030ECDE5C